MTKVVFAFITMLYFLSCKEEKRKDITISIQNHSPYHFDQMDVSTLNAAQIFKNVQPGQKVALDMAVPFLGKQQGAFLLKGYVKGEMVISGTFGYYTSPGNIKPDYTISISQDLTLIEE